MKRFTVLLLLALFAGGCELATQPGDDPQGRTPGPLEEDASVAGVVNVAPPTGDPVTDVANIEAAVAAANPGDVIQFGKGVYAIAADTRIEISTPRVTLQGHERGTTIHGVAQLSNVFLGHFFLNGGQQSVRDLTFDGFGDALQIGAPGTTVGGYLVSGCVFKHGARGFAFFGNTDDVTVIDGNSFVNVGLPFDAFGKTFHFRKNTVTAPDPASIPQGQPYNAGEIIPDIFAGGTPCENIVVEENTIIGNADGFIVGAFPGTACRNNIVRENTFIGQRVFTSGDGGSLVILIGLGDGLVEGNRVEENVFRGSEGSAILLVGATGNYISENEISNLPGEKEAWIAPSGTGVFLDPLSSSNHVIENTFKRVLSPIIDLGTDNVIKENVVKGPSASPTVASMSQNEVPPTMASEKLKHIWAFWHSTQ